jgi:HSP20 family protein
MDNKTQEKQASTTGEVQKSNPPRSLDSHHELDRLFDHFISRNWLSPFNHEWHGKQLFHTPFESKAPHVDIINHDDEILIRSEVPGVDKKDLEVSVTENSVTIKGSTRQEKKDENDEFFRHEITRGSFSRTLSLPCDINCEEIKTSFKDGVLELVAPKAKAIKRHNIKL